MQDQKNNAKFAFFYVLSLIALIFMATSIGMIIFQLINKLIPDVPGFYQGTFSSDTLRNGLSALIISAPIYYFTTRQIFKNLFSGSLDKESGIRKWLTYFILLVASVVMIGWLIGLLNNFLNGELTVKFIIKSVSAILIAGIAFAFYFYDIKREEVEGKKDKIVSIFLYGSIAVVLIAIVSGFLSIDPPSTVRAKRHDQQVISQLEQIDSTVNMFFYTQKKVPKSLDEILPAKMRDSYISEDMIKDPESKKEFEYKQTATDSYEICADFKLSNKGEAIEREQYDKVAQERWAHESGRQCFTRKAVKNPEINVQSKEIPPVVK